jgi:hypothetical protein
MMHVCWSVFSCAYALFRRYGGLVACTITGAYLVSTLDQVRLQASARSGIEVSDRPKFPFFSIGFDHFLRRSHIYLIFTGIYCTLESLIRGKVWRTQSWQPRGKGKKRAGRVEVHQAQRDRALARIVVELPYLYVLRPFHGVRPLFQLHSGNASILSIRTRW